ncbi:FAD dependent oxidoreductase, partial [Pseudomonas syringae pv. pisi str. 1704B]
PAPGLLAATGFNGRGVTTGTLVGKCFADYLLTNDATALPMSFSSGKKVSGSSLRSLAYDAGFTLYHAGQCLRVVL